MRARARERKKEREIEGLFIAKARPEFLFGNLRCNVGENVTDRSRGSNQVRRTRNISPAISELLMPPADGKASGRPGAVAFCGGAYQVRCERPEENIGMNPSVET